MKRSWMILLLMFVLFSAPSVAEEALNWLSPTIGGNNAVMIVDNGDDWTTKLNLRAEPRKGGEIRGRIYTGTRVEIYEDNGEWCTVGLNFVGGSVQTGQVMKRYLTPLRAGFSALCPLATAKEEADAVTSVGGTVAHLRPGDTAYVLAVCSDRYFLMLPDGKQGYAAADAFESLKEPQGDERILYGRFSVPSGGLRFMDEYTGEEVVLAGGLQLEDCWQIAGEEEWHVTFGAGIQRTPRVRGRIPKERLSDVGGTAFEGEVYAHGKSFITCVGTLGGEPILRRVDENGDIFWALGDVPHEAVLFDDDLYEIKCETHELISQAVMDQVRAYVSKRGVLDERTSGERVTREIAQRCSMHAALVLEPGTGKLLHIRVWLNDVDGSYVTGGDLDLKTGEIIRWGCDA